MTSRSCSLLLLMGALLTPAAAVAADNQAAAVAADTQAAAVAADTQAAAVAADEPEALPPTQPGRQVVLESSVLLRAPSERTMSLSDFDAETADIVREINRKPGTWQLYLLYTAEDLPERMFHPGFPIRLSRPRPASVPVPVENALESGPVDTTDPRGAMSAPPPPAPSSQAPAPR